ncbi:MAG: T9SS type A sorting domain-containing protein [Bacteroidales bacterium]|nr:T9SS type A sorting domain-containing protein [Bacteroidales bacterium]
MKKYTFFLLLFALAFSKMAINQEGIQGTVTDETAKPPENFSRTSNGYSQFFRPVINIDSTSWDIAYMQLFGTVMTKLITKNNPDSIYSMLYFYDDTQYLDYAGKIREDTISGKIWFVDPYYNNEMLIMDMGLVKGDTFQIYNNWSTVDSVFYSDNKKIIRFNLQTRWDEPVMFIEGVGPNISLVYASDPDYDRFYATCKYNIDALVYINNNMNFIGCMPDPTRLEDISENEGIIIYPNPTTDKLHIELSHEFPLNSEFILTNAIGQILIQKSFKENKLTIQLNNIKQGTYFATIVNEQYTFNQAIIISN